ncbi:DnaJ protein, putative [Plasmodium malariae]|uniref:DnaJ protein, putative n=1 Tax=Plasmodium malariae TaxID=5858 RepID=A0A1C3KY93_PLAMA|nr:DnaJ protein, putative [Plasmodium malariae]
MKNMNFLINKSIFFIFSKITTFFCWAEKKKLNEQVIKYVENSKIINHPIDTSITNFYFISNEINKLVNIRNKLLVCDKQSRKRITEKCFNLYCFLITSAKLKKKKNNFFKRKILEYVEETIARSIEKIKIEDIDKKLIPYSIYIRSEKSLGSLVADLNIACSSYLNKINSVRIRHLIIDKDEINIDEEWKKKHECFFNKKKLKIPISKHNYEYILNGLHKSSLRKQVLYLLNIPFENKNLNKDVINILKKRYDIATKMGYKNWAHYSISHFTSEKNNYDKVNDFLALVKMKIDKEYDTVKCSMEKTINLEKSTNMQVNIDDKKDSCVKLAIYDWNYYYNKILNKSDEYLINTYFPHAHVLKNFLIIVSKIYNFAYEEVKQEAGQERWGKNSHIYKIKKKRNEKIMNSNIMNGKNLLDNTRREQDKSGSNLLGYIYIMPYKDISFMDYFRIPLIDSLPNTCLICAGHVLIDYRFLSSVPIEKKLFSCSEILTLFHEFGHAYHLLFLSTKYNMYRMSNMPLDYAELFSHINEHVANNYNIMYNLSNNINDNSKINEYLFKTMKFDYSRLANIFSQSMLDYAIHNLDPYEFFDGHQGMVSCAEVVIRSIRGTRGKNCNSHGDSDKYGMHTYHENSYDHSLDKFYSTVEKYFPYSFSSHYSIHSTSFPYHFSCCYAGSVLSYLFAEMRVLLNFSTDNLSLKKNSSLVSFQRKFYEIIEDDLRFDANPSIITHALANKKMLLRKAAH